MIWAGAFLLALGGAGYFATTNQAPEVVANPFDILREQGMLRTEIDPEDVPFDQDDLVAAFSEVVFVTDMTLEAQGTPSVLHRWFQPIRYTMFGSTITQDDIAATEALTERLSTASGVPISRVDSDANVFVMIATAEERSDIIDGMAESVSPEMIEAYRNWSAREYLPCIYQFSYDSRGIYAAFVVIKASYTGDERLFCLHEEFAQIMGLQNDTDMARPSLFNDDQEFARLTVHDEMLLSMLYHEGLTQGMTLDEAAPLLPAIAAEVFEAYGR